MLVVFDLETTGLLKPEEPDLMKQPGIVQLAAQKLNESLEVVDELDLLINPERYFEEKAQEVTGLTPESVAKAPTFRGAFPKIAEFFVGCRHAIGFNIDYDTQVLQYNLRAYGLDRRFPWPMIHHDLMKSSKDMLNLQGKQDQKFAKLTELHQALFGKAFDGAHNAMEDVRATTRCAQELSKRGMLWLT